MPQKTIVSNQIRGLIGLCNQALRLFERMGFQLAEYDVERLLEKAQKETSLSDFGEGDFVEPLQRLLSNIEQQSFSPVATLYLQAEIHRSLVNRLHIAQYCHLHPEVQAHSIAAPIFIVGLPRTGTTALHNILGLLNARRSIPLHELLSPAAPSASKNRLFTQLSTWMLNFAAPEQKYIHAVGAHLPDECWRLLLNHFSTLVLASACDLKEYGQWLLRQDMTSTYRYYRRQLQILQHKEPARKLVLKCPEHLWHLPALFANFPSAKVIWTHRDPFVAIASYASLLSLTQRILFGCYDPIGIGKEVTKIYKIGIDRAMQFRKSLDMEDHFLDVNCLDIATTPMGSVERICEFVQHPLTIVEKDRISAWLRDKRSDSRGAHQYSAAEFGIEQAEITAQFQQYLHHLEMVNGI